MFCGEDDPFFLQVDHIDGVASQAARKEEACSAALAAKKSGYDRTKFRLLCVKCHHIKTKFKEWEGKKSADRSDW